MATSFNGIGTTFYGQCDFEEDASFVTTKWFIIGFFPLVPLSSLRVRYAESTGFFSAGTSYEVLAEMPLHGMQVIKTWLYVALLIGLAVTLLDNQKVNPGVQVTLLVLAAALPTILRQVAKRSIAAAPPAPPPRRRERAAAPLPAGVKITTCPKCAYTRKPDDYAPDWQCPSCKVAYNKVMVSDTVA